MLTSVRLLVRGAPSSVNPLLLPPLQRLKSSRTSPQPTRSLSSITDNNNLESKVENLEKKIEEKKAQDDRKEENKIGTTAASSTPTAAPDARSVGIDKRVRPIALSTFIMGTAIGIVIPIMPMFVKDLGLSTADLGLIGSTMGLVRILVNIPLASLGDIVGRKPLLTVGPVLTAVAQIGTGLAGGFASLVGWRFVTGLSSSAQMTGAQLYLSDISTPQNRARTMAPFTTAWSAGGAVGPVIGGVIAESYGLRAPFFVVGAAVIFVTINNQLLLTETNPVNHSHHISFSQKMKNGVRDAMAQWKLLIRDPSISSVALVHTAFWMAAAGCQFTLLPLLAQEQFQLSVRDLGGIFTLFAVLNVAGAQPAAMLSDYVGRKAAMIPGALITAASLGVIPFLTTSTEFFAALLLWGCGNTLMQGSSTAYVADRTTAQTRSQALAFLRTGGDLGLFIGAASMGFLAEKGSMAMAFETTAGLLALATGLFAWRTRKLK